MLDVNFIYKDKTINIKCNENDKMKELIKKFGQIIKLDEDDIDDLVIYYKETPIKKKQVIKDIIKEEIIKNISFNVYDIDEIPQINKQNQNEKPDKNLTEEEQKAQNTFIKQNQLMDELINNIENEFKGETLNHIQKEILNEQIKSLKNQQQNLINQKQQIDSKKIELSQKKEQSENLITKEKENCILLNEELKEQKKSMEVILKQQKEHHELMENQKEKLKKK